MAFCMMLCNFFVVKDTMEGRYCPIYLQNIHEENSKMFEETQRVRIVTDAHGVTHEVPEEEVRLQLQGKSSKSGAST